MARRFMAMAASWARHIEEEIAALNAHDNPDGACGRAKVNSGLRAKCAIAHSCAVLSFGCAGGDSGLGGGPAGMDTRDGAALCMHHAQAHLHTFNDASDALHARLQTLQQQSAHVMACQAHALSAVIRSDASLLGVAVRSAFGPTGRDKAVEAGCVRLLPKAASATGVA